MANEIKVRDIHERIYKFVLEVFGKVKQIPKTPENLIIIRQVVRSAGSIGANASEAKETFYWLALLTDHNPALKPKFSFILDENQQIIAIISGACYRLRL